MFDHSARRMPQLPRAAAQSGGRVMDRVEEALDGLRYGEVTVIVQDGIIVYVAERGRLQAEARRTIDAGDRIVLPGGVEARSRPAHARPAARDGQGIRSS